MATGANMLGRCLAVFAATHLLSVGSLTALLLLLQHALRNSSSAPTVSTHDPLSFVHVVNVFCRGGGGGPAFLTIRSKEWAEAWAIVLMAS